MGGASGRFGGIVDYIEELTLGEPRETLVDLTFTMDLPDFALDLLQNYYQIAFAPFEVLTPVLMKFSLSSSSGYT